MCFGPELDFKRRSAFEWDDECLEMRKAAREEYRYCRTLLLHVVAAADCVLPQAATVDSEAPGRLDQTPDAASSISGEAISAV